MKDSEAFSATIGRLAQQNGIAAPAAAKMSLELQKLAGAFGQIKGTTPTPYLDALSRALIGNTRGLKQLGISVNSTNETIEAERLGFIKTTVDALKVSEAHYKVATATKAVGDAVKKYGQGSSQAVGAQLALRAATANLNKELAGAPNGTIASLTAAQKAQVIMGVATSHLSQLQKEAAAHSGDLANQTVKLSAEWSNAKDEIGLALLPAVTKLSTVLAKNLPGAMHETAQAFTTGIQDIQPLIPPIVTAMTDFFNLISDHKGLVIDLAVALIAFKVAFKVANEAVALGRDIQTAYNAALRLVTLGQFGQTAAVEATTAANVSSTAATEAATAASTEQAAASTAAAAGISAQTTASVAAAAADSAYVASVEAAVAATAALEGSEASLATALAIMGAATDDATASLVAYDAALLATETEASGGALAAVSNFGGSLLAMAGGGAVVATAAIAGLVGGMIYFASTEEGVVEKATNGLNTAFKHLSTNMNNAGNERRALGKALAAEPEDKLRVAQAKLNVEQAKANLRNKDLNKTTLQHKQNVLNLKTAEMELSGAQKTLTGDERAAAKAGEHLTGILANQWRQVRNLEKAIFNQSKAEFQSSLASATATARIREGVGPRGANLSATEKQALATKATHEAYTHWIKDVQDSAAGQKNLSPLVQHNANLLVEYAKRVGRIPTKHETAIILNTHRMKESLDQVYTLLNGAGIQTRRGGHNIGIGFVDGVVKGVQDRQVQAVNAGRDTTLSVIQASMIAAGIRSPSQKMRVSVGQPLIDGIIVGIQDRRDNLQNAIQAVIQAQVKPAHSEMLALGNSMEQGIIAGLASLGPSLQRSITGAAQAALAGAKKALGISSPSMLFSEQIGVPLMQGILHGLGGLKAGLISQVTSAARAATAATGGFTGGGPAGSAATGANERLGQQMMLQMGWPASQWGALQALWTRESGWNQFAKNASSGAYGIPQSLPASKMASAGGDWLTNPATQIRWGLDYIKGRYGSPAGAWAHELSAGWYQGGTNNYPGGFGIVGEKGPELIQAPKGSRISTAGETRFTFDTMISLLHELNDNLKNRPFIGQVHLQSPALAPEGAARDFLNDLTRRVAMS